VLVGTETAVIARYLLIFPAKSNGSELAP
jgi:hypothetical protein